ncbi:MAG TPA: ABC transporter ATP-binding protein [Intrasporangium sp.]|nr:ABC transporter ATP-binding protein [Intrasporangium sp.]
MPAITSHGLRKTYDGTVAVESLDFAVDRGTILGFLGPNGAGKTTAIRMLSTVLEPDAGSFSVAGIPHTDPVQIRRRVGVLPESAGYPATQTAQEWLSYHAQLFGSPGRAAAATATRLLGEVGLADRAASQIRTMSRGMRQRLGIARALVNDPEVVFLDEPTLGLDPAGQGQVLQLVTSVARERGVTVVLSTHLLAEVEQVCDRVLILNRGRLVSEGTIAETVTRGAADVQSALVEVPAEQREQALELLQRNGIGAASADAGRLREAFLALTEDQP